MFDRKMLLDRPVSDDIAVHPTGRSIADAFGIEVELEGVNVRTESMSIMQYWSMHEDGSLRAQIAGRNNGKGQTVEYVSRFPYSQADTQKSLKALFDYLTSPGVTVYPSYRTSIHVHVNFGLETWRTVYNFITLAIIFDELFVSTTGEHRIGNNFCLRFIDAESPIESLATSIRRYGNIFEFQSNMRYSSVNFAALRKFGTVEFRSLECTTDYNRVVRWIATLQQLKKAARNFKNPVDIINLFSIYTESEFAVKVLGQYFSQYAGVRDYRTMLKRGMRLAQDFAFSATWESETLADMSETGESKYLKKYLKKKPLGGIVDNWPAWAGAQPAVPGIGPLDPNWVDDFDVIAPFGEEPL